VTHRWLSLVLAIVPLAEFVLRWILTKSFTFVADTQLMNALSKSTLTILKQVGSNTVAYAYVSTCFENRHRILDVFTTIGLSIAAVAVAVFLEDLEKNHLWLNLGWAFIAVAGVWLLIYLISLAGGAVEIEDNARLSKNPLKLPRFHQSVALSLDVIAIIFGIAAKMYSP
jgi:hypothetical protein